MDANKHSSIEPELYFLIQKFLSISPLQETYRVLCKELEKHDILPTRLDWKGHKHKRPCTELERLHPHIGPNHLLQICARIGPILDKEFPPSVSGITSLLGAGSQSLLRNLETLRDRNSAYFYATRRNSKPLVNPFCSSNHNIVQVLQGRELSGPVNRFLVCPPRYSSLILQRQTLGHLSAVYCLMFDHTGKYIITGADDLLIKLWSSISGRLLATFRGASSEITDIDINLENTLLAAGSIDRILRVWNMQNGAPVAVLSVHTGMITSVNFSPLILLSRRYLITTSTDGSVAFWTYEENANKSVTFAPQPTTYHERIRPGQAKMICSSFSPGGNFLATGCADHHVRIYQLLDEGPKRILEMEAHADRVDSIQWAHNGLRFVSGSKDGTAYIWHFEGQQWRNMKLNMNTKLPDSNTEEADDSKKLKVTMVCWDVSDTWIITAVSDSKLKVWTAHSAHLSKVLSGHTDEIYVLESHPQDPHIVLSAGHDGQIFIWNILQGKAIKHFTNNIEGQGYGAVFDAKWSPCGNMIAASDSHGHILMFGLGSGNASLKFLPKELFFHTDYRPLVRDANNVVLDEQTQIAPHVMPPPFLVDIDGNPYPPMLQRLVPGRENCDSEQLIPNIVIGNEGLQEVIEGLPAEHEYYNQQGPRQFLYARPGIRTGMRTSSDVEGIRQTSGNWQKDTDIVWGSRVLVKPMHSWQLKSRRKNAELIGEKELSEYITAMKHRPIMIHTLPSVSVENNKAKRKKKHYHTRSVEVEHTETDEEDNGDANSSGTEFSTSKEDSASSDSFSESSGYSDWVADEGVNLEPPKRSKRKQKKRQITPPADEPEEPEPKSSTSKWEPQKLPPKTAKLKEVPEIYKPLDWLSETIPKKAPYFPQMGDEVVYFVQGHQLYVNAVITKKIYETNSKDFPWTKMQLKDQEIVKVVGIKYEIRPPRLCCLKLAFVDQDNHLTGHGQVRSFTVKYHDMPDVLDFFVLRQTYDTAISRNWDIGDRFRCMIDDGWWIGEVISKSPVSEEFPNSLFMYYEIRWNNGESERMSPWDMEPLKEDRMPENPDEAVLVLPEELQSMLYQPQPEEWPNGDREGSTQRIVDGLERVMGLAIAEPFLVPVDLNVYPGYAFVVEYPVDLSTIKARFANNFYRRVTSAQFDVRYLATNAEKFNEPHSSIVKHARIVTELCLKVINSDTLDVNTVYHQLVDSYVTSDSDVEVDISEPGPSTSATTARSQRPTTRTFNHPDDWKLEARKLLDALWHCEDSVPFRTAVDRFAHTDYYQTIDTPMDLSLVKEELLANNYETPNDFCKDMRLIFQNSKNYNTNKRSRIYAMTVRLSAMFEEHMGRLLQAWKVAQRKQNRPKPMQRRAITNKRRIESSEASMSGSEESADPLAISSSGSSSSSSSSSSSGPLVKKPNQRSNGHVQNGASNSLNSTILNGVVKNSSSSSSSGEDDSDYEPLSKWQTRKEQPQTSRKKAYPSSSDDDSEDEICVRTTRKAKRARYAKETDSDEDDDDDASGTSGRSSSAGGAVTISSRGRVRRLTARARALLKK